MRDEAKAAYEAWLASIGAERAALYCEYQNQPFAVREAWNAATQLTMQQLYKDDQKCDD